MASRAGERLHFESGAVQLEMTLTITRKGSGDAGIRFGVVSFGANWGLKDETTHHLTLPLQPVVKDADSQTKHAEIAGKSSNEPR